MKNKAVSLILAGVVLFAGGILLWAQSSGGRAQAKEPPMAQAEGKPQPLPRMVDVGKTWCIPCKKMVAVLEEAERRYRGKALIEFVDLEKDPEAAQRYKIQMIPTQVFFTADGKEFERHVGFMPFEEVEKVFAKMGVERSG
jgi:thioredoxin 1